MTNDSDPNKPASDSEQHSPSKSESLTSTPEQGKVGTKTEKSANEQPTVAQEMRREFRRFEFGSLFINGALVVVVKYALCIYNGQLIGLRKSTKAAQDAAIAAKSAADTANATLQSSQKSFEIDQRPYLVSQTPEFAELPVANKEIYANETIKNIGRTPAIKRLSAISLTRFDPGTKGKLLKFLQSGFKQLRVQNETNAKQMESYASTIPDAEMDVAPQDSYFGTNQNSIKLSEDELKKLRDGTGVTLFYIGLVNYTDS